MILCLIRHGQDDPTVRGGWSDAPLTEEGACQAESLSKEIAARQSEQNISRILSSPLPRAVQTARPAADRLHLPIEFRPEFSEINNGELAGLKNELALERYPGLFYNTLRWDDPYPGGESPHMFFDRISTAWSALCAELVAQRQNALLFTHGGVIHVLLHLIEGTVYSNRDKQPSIAHASLIPVELSGTPSRFCASIHPGRK